MKRRISKRIIAIGMSLCVAFSIMPLSVSAEAEAGKEIEIKVVRK